MGLKRRNTVTSEEALDRVIDGIENIRKTVPDDCGMRPTKYLLLARSDIAAPRYCIVSAWFFCFDLY